MVKQLPPTPVRFSAEQELAIAKAAQKDGKKLSTWIKSAVMEKLSRKPRVRKINERNDQEQVN